MTEFDVDSKLARGLLEAAPDAIVIVDEEGRIRFANAQAERMFGYAGTELLGTRIETLIPERFRTRHEAHRDAYAHEPRVRPMGANLELHARHRDGHEFPVEISLSPFDTPDGRLVSAAVRDISERKRAEEAIRRQSMTRGLVRRLVVTLIHRGGISASVVRDLGRELADQSGAKDLPAMLQAFRDMGLGDVALEKRENSTFTFTGSDLLERRRETTQPTCYLALSYLEGAVSAASGHAALGTETSCQSRGDEKCRFVVRARGAERS